jgi:hypothetical protein
MTSKPHLEAMATMVHPHFAVALNKDAADVDEVVFDIFGPFEGYEAAMAFVDGMMDRGFIFHWHIQEIATGNN